MEDRADAVRVVVQKARRLADRLVLEGDLAAHSAKTSRRLTVTVDREVVVSVHATLEFLHEGADLIGLPVPAALWRLGGAVSREGGEIEIIQTAIGAELYCRDDYVVGVSVSRWELVQE